MLSDPRDWGRKSWIKGGTALIVSNVYRPHSGPATWISLRDQPCRAVRWWVGENFCEVVTTSPLTVMSAEPFPVAGWTRTFTCKWRGWSRILFFGTLQSPSLYQYFEEREVLVCLTWKVFLDSALRFSVHHHILLTRSFYSSILKMEATAHSETPEKLYQTARYLARVKDKFILGLTFSRPVCPGIRLPSTTAINFSFSSIDIVFRQLRHFIMGRPLWREYGSVIFSAATPLSEPRKTHNRPLQSHSRFGSPYLYHPGLVWPSYAPSHWVPFSSPLNARRDTAEVFYPASFR
jgi:hypothetical protein